MAYTFDQINKLIHVSLPQTEVKMQDLINQIRLEESSWRGMAYDRIANASGKESLGGSVFVGITVQLLGWQVKFEEGNYIARISGGNLVGGITGDPVAYSAGVQTLLIQSASSTIVQTSTGSGLSLEQNEKLMTVPDANANARAVWDQDQAGEKLTNLFDFQNGKWTIANNQMIFFKADNLTEIARFNLFDADGNPTMENVLTRERH